jgi:hypothetical protein
MFKINNLKLVNSDKEEFIYKFSNGINYIQGKNDTGKTVFYNFIDYMFGSSKVIGNEDWFENLDCAELEFTYRNKSFSIKRTIFQNENYMKYTEKTWGSAISLNQYKEKLNSIFTIDVDHIKILRDFAEEDLTYRTFTLFNFLGEKSLGRIQDFFDKCSDFKYSMKLSSILNLLFNNNIEKIFQIEADIMKLKKDLSSLEAITNIYKFNERIINTNLNKLDAKISYNGKNSDEVLNYLTELKTLKETTKTKKSQTVSELESMYHSISQQIKVYENRTMDTKQFELENKNKLMLIEALNSLVSNQKEYNYLISPIQDILKDINTNISFNKYYINDGTIKKLKEEKSNLKEKLKANDSRFLTYNMDETSFIIKLIEEGIDKNNIDKTEEIESKKKELQELRKTLLILKNEDNKEKIDELSEYISSLYLSAKNVSELVSRDAKINASIKYLKKGNILQPIVSDFNDKENEESEAIESENYYIGSNARHTLIQLCGYLGFIRLLVNENKYPIIPFLVFDHISKPFDRNNSKAIGQVFNEFYKSLPKGMIQIIIFDDKPAENLGIKYDKFENLETDKKSGFNPFYIK